MIICNSPNKYIEEKENNSQRYRNKYRQKIIRNIPYSFEIVKTELLDSIHRTFKTNTTTNTDAR